MIHHYLQSAIFARIFRQAMNAEDKFMVTLTLQLCELKTEVREEDIKYSTFIKKRYD